MVSFRSNCRNGSAPLADGLRPDRHLKGQVRLQPRWRTGRINPEKIMTTPATDPPNKHYSRFHLPHLYLNSVFGDDWFALKVEAFARFFGTPMPSTERCLPQPARSRPSS
jgi:hypothetical protein